MTATYTKDEWAKATMDQTFGNVICVKTKIRYFGRKERPDCGFVVIPKAIQKPTNDQELYAAFSKQTEVTVLGHGMMDMPSEYVVWKGTPQEFEETWRGD